MHHAQVKGDLAKLQLTSPVCTKQGEKIALSRRVEKHWRLIGWGQIQNGEFFHKSPNCEAPRHSSIRLRASWPLYFGTMAFPCGADSVARLLLMRLTLHLLALQD